MPIHLPEGTEIKDDDEESDSSNWETDSDIGDPPPENSILTRCSSTEYAQASSSSRGSSPSLRPGSSPSVCAKSSPSLRAGSSPSVQPSDNPSGKSPFVHVEEEEEDENSPLCKDKTHDNHKSNNSPSKTCPHDNNSPYVHASEIQQPSPSQRAASLSSSYSFLTAPISKAGHTPFLPALVAEDSISTQSQISPSAIVPLCAQSSTSTTGGEFMFGPL